MRRRTFIDYVIIERDHRSQIRRSSRQPSAGKLGMKWYCGADDRNMKTQGYQHKPWESSGIQRRSTNQFSNAPTAVLQ